MRITTTIAVALLSLGLSAQATTDEEFNYLTKGYKIQVESGLDMKKGYHIELLDSLNTNSSGVVRIMKFHGLYRSGATKPCAMLCVMTRPDTKFTGYTCLPSFDAGDDMWNKAIVGMVELYGDNQQAMSALLYGHMHLASKGYTR